MSSFALRRSRDLALILCCAHALALAVICALDVPLWVKVCAVPVLGVSLWFYVQRDARLEFRGSVVGIRIKRDGTVELTTRAGAVIGVSFLPGSLVTPLLTVVKYRAEGNRFARRIAIWRDMLDAEDFRKLRVYLKWGVPAAEPKSEPAQHYGLIPNVIIARIGRIASSCRGKLHALEHSIARRRRAVPVSAAKDPEGIGTDPVFDARDLD